MGFNLENQIHGQSQNVQEFEEDEINLLEILRTLGEEKWWLLGIPMIIAIITAVISLVLTPVFTAKAVFVVPSKQSSSASAILDQLGGAAALAGASGLVGGSTGDMYAAFLQSNTVRDELIEKFHLIERYESKDIEAARKEMNTKVKIASDKKTSLLSVEASDKEPQFAADLANAHLDSLRKMLKKMSVAEAQQRRDFFDQQIDVISQRPFRDPFVQSQLMANMIRQYEAARLDEARDAQVLQEVDLAQAPIKRSSPKRAQMAIIAGLAGFFLALMFVFIKRAIRGAKTNPETASDWQLMLSAWRLGKKSKP